jgi:hypothetical protein
MQFVSLAPSPMAAPAYYGNPSQFSGYQIQQSPQTAVVNSAPVYLHQHAVPAQQFVLSQQFSQLSVQNVPVSTQYVPVTEHQTICWGLPKIIGWSDIEPQNVFHFSNSYRFCVPFAEPTWWLNEIELEDIFRSYEEQENNLKLLFFTMRLKHSVPPLGRLQSTPIRFLLYCRKKLVISGVEFSTLVMNVQLGQEL